MAEKFRFRAFISYSHRDERWAKWLHGALESYRLPRKLVGKPGAVEPVPQYFAPVFRDRDELPTSPDLSDQVRRALEDSAALIVVCSPAAADSRWVNEEIRRFRALGRADRIFCLIVDGSPEATNAGERCFPPALFEDEHNERHEPLAADARRFADGKTLAKLKLVSGILGVRLDALRQREQQRRRVRILAAVVAGVAALALVAVTVFSAFEERRQREALDRYVADTLRISNQLQSVANLETLRLIGGMIYQNLQAIDESRATSEQKRQLAQVLRNLGEVYYSTNEFDEAGRAFGDSLEILASLQGESPGDMDLLLDRGIGEYWVGAVRQALGDLDGFAEAMNRYLDAAQTAAEAQPENLRFQLEKASALVNLGIDEYQRTGGDLDLAMSRLDEGVTTLEAVRSGMPDDADVRAAYIEGVAWLADVQHANCDIGGAVVTRLKSVDLIRSMLAERPTDPGLRERLADRLAGIGGLKEKLGLYEQALENYERASGIFADLERFDPGNPQYRWWGLVWRTAEENLRARWGDPEAVGRLAALVDEMSGALAEPQQVRAQMRSDYAYALMQLADVSALEGATAQATEAVAEALALTLKSAQDNLDDRAARRRLALATFLAWEQGLDYAPAYELVQRAGPDSSAGGAVNCVFAPLEVRMAILEGDRQRAEMLTGALLKTGYWEPAFVQVCRRYDLCPER